jgi:hypothetical protein
MFMNEYEIEEAQTLFRDDAPNLQRAASTLARLMEWTNQNSDGWPYWRKPTRAAAQLMTLVQSHTYAARYGDVEDVSATDLTKALSPIKSFLTRQGVPHALIMEATQ